MRRGASQFSDDEAHHPAKPEPEDAETRREFLGRLGATVAVAAAAEAGGAPREAAAQTAAPDLLSQTPLTRNQLLRRRKEAYQLRISGARRMLQAPFEMPLSNGDEALYANKIGSFSKTLPHNGLGEVDLGAYQQLVHACETGIPEAFEQIPLGGTTKLKNPQAGLAFVMEGGDSHQFSMPATPTFASAEAAGELVELYWQALLRDVNFDQYGSDLLALQAAADLSALSDFRGPKSGGVVTPDTLFRGPWAGNLGGPYVSQFLYLPYRQGAMPISQAISTLASGVDYLTSYTDWLDSQNGGPAPAKQVDPLPRYIRNGRDLAEWVHGDYPYLAGMIAALICFGMGGQASDDPNDLLSTGAPVDASNPYLALTRQCAFPTFGPPDILDLVARVGVAALRAAWFQKWRVHRRLRPEEFGGRVHNHVTGATSYAIHADVLNAGGLAETFGRFGSYLLPQAYPEGSPAHTAYPSGHATFAGATITVLKAVLDEEFVIPSPVQPASDGLSLVPYSGPPLTIGGELNKLAFHIGMGRNFAGIHWRTDASEGNRLGEAVAISLLKDLKLCYNEPFAGWTLTRFDGTTITI